MIKNIPLSDYLITGIFIINLYYDYFFFCSPWSFIVLKSIFVHKTVEIYFNSCYTGLIITNLCKEVCYYAKNISLGYEKSFDFVV